MERILEENDVQTRALTWEQLGYEAGLDVSGRIVQRHMGTMEYHKCIACGRGWVNAKTAEHRVKWSDVMLERYPKPEDWEHVWFSDEVHFGNGPQGQLHIIQKPGMRTCQNCIQEADAPDEKDKKRRHCWAAAGYNFKSEIHFYNVPGNTNSKMSQRVYIDAILIQL